MKPLSELLSLTESLHRHLCPRQVLGVRTGLLAGCLLGLELPQRRSDKRVFAFVETDGCFADSLSVATGCWLGHRTMRLVDFGKVAATLVDTKTGAAVRIAPHPLCRTRAREALPRARSRWHAQVEAYQVLPDDELLAATPVRLTVDLAAIISRPGRRVNCRVCGEEIINAREIIREGCAVCRACAGAAYYQQSASGVSGRSLTQTQAAGLSLRRPFQFQSGQDTGPAPDGSMSLPADFALLEQPALAESR